MSDPFFGQIIMFGGNFAPRGWAFCEGQLLPIAQNTALFSILGTTYGGDGRTTFALPALRGRIPVGAGSGPGLSTRQLGEKSGIETVTLQTAQIPNHGHSPNVEVNTGAGSENSPNGQFLASINSRYSEENTPNANLGGVQESTVGGNQAHNNMAPSQAVSFIIALTGTFPSRS